jgi:hypothetical protein
MTALAAEQPKAQPAPRTGEVWQPMLTAPHDRPILLRSRWAGRPVAMVGVYMPVHGAWCTQPFFGQGEQIIHAGGGWTDIPELDGSFL